MWATQPGPIRHLKKWSALLIILFFSFRFALGNLVLLLTSHSSLYVYVWLLSFQWGWAPMWHWLFATLSLPGKPSPSPKIPSNEKQTWLGISCGVTAFRDFVLNPRACFETSRGHWKMKYKRCGNLVFLPLTAMDRGQLNWGRREVEVPGWRSTSHLAKLTVSHPSIPTVFMGESSTRCYVGSFEPQDNPPTLHSYYRSGDWSDMLW